MMKHRLYSARALLPLLLVLLLSGCSFLPQEEELPSPPVYRADALQYEQVQVQRGDLQEWDTFSCTYKAAVEEKVIFQLGGMEVARVYVALGDDVKAGQLLAELDTTEIDEKMDAQQEKIRQLETEAGQLDDTRAIAREKERLELEKIGARVSRGEATQAEYNAKKAANDANEKAYLSKKEYYSSLISIEKERYAALQEERLQYSIYAGIDGTVRYVGSVDQPSSDTGAFVIISDYTTNRFVCTVKQAGLFHVGDTVTITPSDKTVSPLEATVIAVEDVSTSSSNKYEVSLQPLIPNSTLKNGDKGKIEYLMQESLDTLYLPAEVVQINPQFSLVYCVDESGALYTKVVTVGMATDDYVEIKEGLEEGEYVVDNHR